MTVMTTTRRASSQTGCRRLSCRGKQIKCFESETKTPVRRLVSSGSRSASKREKIAERSEKRRLQRGKPLGRVSLRG